MAAVQFPSEIAAGLASGVLTRIKYIFDDNGVSLETLLQNAGSGSVSYNSITHVLTVNESSIDLSPLFAISDASITKVKGIITLQEGETASDALAELTESSVGDIYLISSEDGEQSDSYDEYIRVQTGTDNGVPVYSWERLGTISAAKALTPTVTQIGGGNTNYKITF